MSAKGCDTTAATCQKIFAACRSPIYEIKAAEMLVQMQNHIVLINRYALVGLRIWILALNSGEILREFGEILGKYRILEGRSVGSKGKAAEVGG